MTDVVVYMNLFFGMTSVGISNAISILKPFIPQTCLNGLDIVEQWGKKLNILRHGYQGGGYNGINSKHILDNCDSLRSQLPNAVDCFPAIDALQALKNVVTGQNSLFNQEK